MYICIIVQAAPFCGVLLQIIQKSKYFLPFIKKYVTVDRVNDSQQDHWGFFHSIKKTVPFGGQKLRKI